VGVHGEGFGEEICQVVRTFAIHDLEVALTNAVPNPVETHVNGLGSAEFDGVVCNAGGTFVVAKENSGWLKVV